MATYTLDQLAKKLDAKLHGDASCLISGVASVAEATAGHACFVESAKYAKELPSTQASVVLLNEDLVKHCPTNALVVQRPRLAFASLLELLYPFQTSQPGIHPSAVIGQNCKIHASASIAALAVIGDDVQIGQDTIIGAGCVIGNDVQIGDRGRLYPRVTVYESVKIGSQVIIHSGVVIGADGFGFEPNSAREWVKLLQVGTVIIGDDVEIGANTTIDRGAIGDTVIGHGVKIDNLVMVAHNVSIGDHTIIAGCTGIAGSAKIGRHCIIGGDVAINGHITIADHVILTGSAMVMRSLLEPGIYSSGTGILPNADWLKSAARFKQLDDMYDRLKKLERVHND